MKKTTLTIILFLGTLLLLQGCVDQQTIRKPINYTDQPQKTIEPPSPLSVNGTKMEKLTHKLVNQERKEHGLSELEWNSELAAVARKHSEYLASHPENHGFEKNQSIHISHIGKDGEKHAHRLEEANIYYTNGSAENVAGIGSVNSTYIKTGEPASYLNSTQIAQRAVKGWMNSTGHRKHILDSRFEETGVGIAKDPTNTTYIFTQLFINRANCGYRYGECCKNQGCFVGLKCIDSVCLNNTK